MNVQTVDIDSIIPYDKNPRKNADSVKAVKESIKQCGYIAPIIVNENMVILAGHTRYNALKSMGREQIEVIVQGGAYTRTATEIPPVG